MHPMKLLNTAESNRILEMIPDLYDNVEHWLKYGCRVTFLLEQWLSGAVPLLRCAATKEDGRLCLTMSYNRGVFQGPAHVFV